MTFAHYTERIDGLQYLADKMELSGSRVRRYLMQLPFCTRKETLETHFDILQKALDILSDPAAQATFMQLQHLFSRVHDVRGTLRALKENRVLDEVELFEMKYLAVLCKDVAGICLTLAFPYDNPDPLEEVRMILDPDNAGTVSFHLYDSYSPALSQARHQAAATDPEKETEQWTRLQDLVAREELAVRKRLSSQLSSLYPVLSESFDSLARMELWFAKASLARRFSMVRPGLAGVRSPDDLKIEGMFNPGIADALSAMNRVFQPVSLTLGRGPCLLTGANMSGKTVVLKTLALIQVLTQFSFFVPARKASVPLVKDVFLVSGDKQDQSRGLSSFAAEMVFLDQIMARIRGGLRALVLVDEPARTTNPSEGAAILCALVEFMEDHHVMSLLSTHYGDLGLSCRKIRVSGFDSSKVKDRPDPSKMNEYINYSLVEDLSDSVLMEALRIARLLGVDESFIQSAQKYVK